MSGTDIPIAAVLLIVRRPMTVRFAAGAFVVVNLMIFAELWITANHFAANGLPWTPFLANKVGALAAALWAPEIWSGIIVIAGFTGTAVAQYLSFPPSVQQLIPLGEPWTTLAFGGFAGAFLYFQLRGRAVEVEVLRARLEAASLERLAQTLLAIQDLANTPLQTIELTVAVLRQQRPELTPALDRLDRAAERLHELNRILAGHESAVNWSRKDESFDARERLGGPARRVP
jgi:hypothetical protein